MVVREEGNMEFFFGYTSEHINKNNNVYDLEKVISL